MVPLPARRQDSLWSGGGRDGCGSYGQPLRDPRIQGHTLSPDLREAAAARCPLQLLGSRPQLPRPHRGHGRPSRPATYPTAPSPNQRAVNALIGHRDDIVIPKDSSGVVQPEGQLAVVIGKQARNVSKENALDYVFGYTIGNDISQRVWQQTDRTLWRCKNADTFKPLGPWIATNLDPSDLRIIVRHNGAVTQDFSSADQIWDVATWIHELTKYMTLTPGDILWMGTQGADGDMVAGDVIEVEIDGIGVLRNQVVAEG